MAVALANLIGEAVWLSQYNPLDNEVGLVVHVAGDPGDADGDVTVTMETLTDEDTVPEQIFQRVADHPETGTYTITPSSAETAELGFYKLIWDYEVGAEPKQFVHALEVVPASPELDLLPEGPRQVLDSVWVRFADLFDSPFGGPHLTVYYQTRFNRGRVAQLMATALRKINLVAQPHMTYGIYEGQGKEFPVNEWGGLLEQCTYIECIKHLMRSYAEQPTPQGVTVARLDRSHYMSQWGTILQMEQREYEEMLDHFKIRHMGLGRPRILVGGGVYGTYAPTRFPHSAAARPRYYWRFY